MAGSGNTVAHTARISAFFKEQTQYFYAYGYGNREILKAFRKENL